jgi:hypothetical protein
MTKLQIAEARMVRAGLRYQKAVEDCQRAITLGYSGSVLESFDSRVASAKAVCDAAYAKLKLVRG